MPLIVVPLAIDIVSIIAVWTSSMTLGLKIVLMAAVIIKFAFQFVGILVERPAWKHILCACTIPLGVTVAITAAFMGEWFVFVPCLAGMLLFVGWWSISTFNLSWESNRRRDESREKR